MGKGCLRQLLTNLLACASDRLVIIIQYNAHFVHELDLLLIVALERIVVAGGVVRSSNDCCVDFGEKARNVFGRDFGLLGDSNGGAHLCDWYKNKRKTVKVLVGKLGGRQLQDKIQKAPPKTGVNSQGWTLNGTCHNSLPRGSLLDIE